jgi:PRC-barrel domain
MTMQADPAELIGAHVMGTLGEDVGPIQQVFAEDRSGMAAWIRVRTGIFGNKNRFIPLARIQRSKRGVKVPYTKQQIKDGPELDTDGHLSPEQVTELALYYGLIGATAWPRVSPADAIPQQRSSTTPARANTP